MGNYIDNILWDVLMEACYILFGRSWQFDKKTTDNSLTTEINFTHQNKKFILFPLTPSQVIEDQV